MDLLVNLEDVRPRDELLGPLVDETTLTEAHEALYVIAMNCRVDKSKIGGTFWVKRYIEAYSFWRTAILKSYSAGGGAFRGSEDNKDSYAQKIAFYEVEMKSLEAKVTERLLTGGEADSGGFKAVRLYRG